MAKEINIGDKVNLQQETLGVGYVYKVTKTYAFVHYIERKKTNGVFRILKNRIAKDYLTVLTAKKPESAFHELDQYIDEMNARKCFNLL